MVKYTSSYDKISTIILSVTTSAVLASMAVLLSSNTSADSTSANATVTVGSACTMTATVNTAHTAEVPAGSTKADIGSTTLNTICNDAGGYAIYAVGYSGDEYGNNKMLNGINEINTGTGSSASNWNMSLSQVTTGTYATTIDGGFGSYSAIPSTYTKVAHRDSATSAIGSSTNLTYGAYIATTQVAGDYVGKVKFTMVHPIANPIQPQNTAPGYIAYYPNTGVYEGTMGRQELLPSDTSATLFASNFSKSGYGFAGWNTAYDYSGKFFGPNELISFEAGQYTGTNAGLSLYAVWVESRGYFQDTATAISVCSSLSKVNYDSETGTLSASLSSVSALTDTRDNQTYAIAKLADDNCWMIENMRIDNSAELTLNNTNNPLNNGTTVTLKHSQSTTYNTLAPSLAPSNWCIANDAYCIDISRINTDNTVNRTTFANNTETMSNRNVNIYSYGNYYNYYSATAGRGPYSKVSGDIEGDICPIGWKIPYGRYDNLNTGSYAYLTDKMGGTSTTPSTNSVTGENMGLYWHYFPNNIVDSGGIITRNISSRGSTALFYSSGIIGRYSASVISISNTGVSFGQNNKFNGRPVRCLLLLNS
ncbi:MAG: hypothetical protein Q4A70_02260 [Candidatus Saccharibacteria bacterium]|nr:hypothetical protein [Candidatus Saccharibacteria bacterium]